MSRLPSNVTNAICYIRKSREDEEAELRGEDTLAKQRDLMTRDILSRYDFNYDLAEEVASGDSIKDRPVFRDLLPKLGTKYQAIVCKDLSRLGRGSYGDMGIVYDIIRDRRIYIITKDAVFDPRNFSDLRMIRFSLFFNREEYEMTLWRLTEGKYDGASKGKWVAGSVPFGYVYDSKTQVLVPHEDESKVVKLIFHMYVEEGLGFRAIATKLRRLGYKSPRGKDMWQVEVIHRMLQNRAYNGTLVFRKTQRNKHDGRIVKRPEEEHIVVEEAFDPIIDPETWEKSQLRLNQGQRKPKVKLDFAPCELAGIIRCYVCKRKMIRQSSTQYYTKQDGSRSRYDKEFLYCTECGYSIKYRDCESQLLETLKAFTLFDEDLLNAKIDEMVHSHDRKDELNVDDVLEQLEEKRKTILKRMERARDFLLDGTFTKHDFEEAKHKCERDLAEIEAGMAYAQGQVSPAAFELPKYDLSHIKNTIHSVLDAYHTLQDKSRKNTLLSSIFDNVELELVEKGRGKNHPTKFNLLVLFKREIMS